MLQFFECKRNSLQKERNMSVLCISDDHIPTKSRAGERSSGSSRLRTTDPPAEEQSKQFAAAKPGDTHTHTARAKLQSIAHCTDLDIIQILFEAHSDVEWLGLQICIY